MSLETELRDETSETKILPNPLPICGPMRAQFELQKGQDPSRPRLAGEICPRASPALGERCTGRDSCCHVYLRELEEHADYK
ncbi:hypothetical protein KY360_04765 [Candidatus Woesearchaeota archaeon]|nr:hypothetical protein [Candidatus Woesearchaeota archaeon]